MSRNAERVLGTRADADGMLQNMDVVTLCEIVLVTVINNSLVTLAYLFDASGQLPPHSKLETYFPNTRLAATLSDFASYLYHQIDEFTLAEESYEQGFCVHTNISIATSG